MLRFLFTYTNSHFLIQTKIEDVLAEPIKVIHNGMQHQELPPSVRVREFIEKAHQQRWHIAEILLSASLHALRPQFIKPPEKTEYYVECITEHYMGVCDSEQSAENLRLNFQYLLLNTIDEIKTEYKKNTSLNPILSTFCSYYPFEMLNCKKEEKKC